jgi:cardiolipin synthase
MVAIPMLLFYGKVPLGSSVGFSFDTRVWGIWLIYLAAVLTIWSMLYYMKLAWPQIRERGGVH